MVEDPTCLQMKVQPHECTEKAGNESLKNKTDESSVKAVFLNFASSTTAHGISNFATSAVWTAKVSWFLVWLSVVAGFIFMIVQLAILYQSKPVSTNVKVSYEKVLKFPGVTICNLNIVRQSPSADFFKQNLTFGMNSSQKADLYKSTFAKKSVGGLDSSTLEADDAAVKRETILQNINKLPESEKIKKGYQFESFIIHCEWAGIRCDLGTFKQLYWVQQWNWRYGNCYTFNGFTMVNNTKVYPLNVSSSIDKLLLTLDIQSREYQPTLTTEVGIRVVIQDQDFVILPDKMGVSIPPGASASISIRKKEIITEDVYNNGSCKSVVDIGGFGYSLQACERYCEHLKEVEVCSCTSLANHGNSNASLCETLRQEQCSLTVKRNFTDNVYNCDDICPVPCSDVIYDQTITQGKMFPSGYKTIYGEENQTELYVTENIIQLSVYYGSKAVETIETKAYYKFENLISDVGGQLGLWIGVSAVTCIEFITLMWNVIAVLMRRKKSKTSQF